MSELRLGSRLVVFLLLVRTVCAQTAPPSAARIAHFDGDRPAALTYTFDDNLRDQYTIAVPMLNEIGFKGTFFIIPGVTAETPEEGEQKEREEKVSKRWGGMCWPQVKEIASHGHEIGNHTWSHEKLSNATPEIIEAEMGKGYDAIKTRIGKPPLTIAVPYNTKSPEIEAAALRHHVACRSYQIGTSEKTTIEKLNTWADKQVAEKTWGVFMAHGIATGYAALADPEILRAHFKYVKSREREIWVDTFANVARYQRERDDAKLTVSEKAGSLTCVLRSTLDPKLYDVPLTIVIEGKRAKSAQADRAGKQLPTYIENGTIYFKAVPDAQQITLTWK